MKLSHSLLFFLIFAALPVNAQAERPWWVEGAYASADLSELDAPPVLPAGLPAMERLPSVLTLISQTADQYDIDPTLLRALVAQESAYDPAAISEDGAIGLGQLMPVVANWCGVENRFHRVDNLDCAGRHLRVLLDKYDGAERLALAAYNAGPGRVNQWVKQYGDPRHPDVDPVDWVEIIPFSETRNYVQRILETVQVYRHRLKGEDLRIQLVQDLTR